MKDVVEAMKPDFVVKSIRRGSDDGNFASISDAGILTLQLNRLPSQKQGYIFEIVEGKFEDKLFYETPVTPSEFAENEGSFSFIWLDGHSDEQEPFKIKIKIVGVSISGDKSDPQYLEVSHAGIKKPWWKLW
ncbi:hypothetical protein [uncultured Shewanella sp.]|uniref:hypothetical protein n=1 Tax=uncultured Shewanella sp. TaxID=173975 RepID=UPI0026364905|nr:hypothetical protein [uncultured Shewanella sp.]